MAVPEQDTTDYRVLRMARFAAGARRVVVRAVTIGALAVAGWLLAVLFGMLTAAPAAADVTATAGSAVVEAGAETVPGAGSFQAFGDSSQASGDALQALVGTDQGSASDNAAAMAGRTVDGLNSQRDPGLPSPSTAGQILDTNGLVPNGGGSGPFGSATGDIARSVFDPRLQARRALPAYVPPPVVRTAADDPSFSPD
ncbi:hypothetical protein [Nonomuraea polychroma]|uniref:hypothetical protein n=1 Tax=Nonomuraea polychroma TaxID=46176 RepID=UPI001F4D638B|nr:hypothetical protein [Nonomuraea polychroma]